MSGTGEVVELAVSEIGPGPDVRSERLDLDHAQMLREVVDLLPPITVRLVGSQYRLIDGQHRLSAHRFEGRKMIRAIVVDLPDAEALEAAVAANIEHGKPLSLAERKSVARKLAAETDWSDRRVAEACGISPRTVAGARPVDQPRLPREGSDGKIRPATKAATVSQRDRIRECLTHHTDWSLRKVAKELDVSPTTVCSVKSDMVTDQPDRAAAAKPDIQSAASRAAWAVRRDLLRLDPAELAVGASDRARQGFLDLAADLREFADKLEVEFAEERVAAS